MAIKVTKSQLEKIVEEKLNRKVMYLGIFVDEHYKYIRPRKFAFFEDGR